MTLATPSSPRSGRTPDRDGRAVEVVEEIESDCGKETTPPTPLEGCRFSSVTSSEQPPSSPS